MAATTLAQATEERDIELAPTSSPPSTDIFWAGSGWFTADAGSENSVCCGADTADGIDEADSLLLGDDGLGELPQAVSTPKTATASSDEVRR